MIGITEIIFSIIIFALIWYAIFKFKLIYEKKKINNKERILKRIEEQNNEKVIIEGIKAKTNIKSLGEILK